MPPTDFDMESAKKALSAFRDGWPSDRAITLAFNHLEDALAEIERLTRTASEDVEKLCNHIMKYWALCYGPEFCGRCPACETVATLRRLDAELALSQEYANEISAELLEQSELAGTYKADLARRDRVDAEVRARIEALYTPGESQQNAVVRHILAILDAQPAEARTPDDKFTTDGAEQ